MPCTAAATEMICVIPPFEVNGLPPNISYTIQVGAAPGPDLTNGRLTLDVKSNPVFAEDGSAIDEGESGLLTIVVSQCPCTVSCDDHLTVYRLPTWTVWSVRR